MVIGNAALVSGATTHALEAPLRILDYRVLQNRRVHQAADLVVDPDVRTIGREAYEIDALISFETAPVELLDILEGSADGEALAYLPDAADTDVQYGVEIVNVGDLIELARDRQMALLGRWEAEVTFRGVGTNFEGLLTALGYILVETPSGYSVQRGRRADADAFFGASPSGYAVDTVDTGVRIVTSPPSGGANVGG